VSLCLPALWCGLVLCVGCANGSNERRIESGEGLVVEDGVYIIDVSKDRTGRRGDLIQSISTQITTFTFFHDLVYSHSALDF
jgi:hypothetical protein